MTIHIGLVGGGNISETHARAARAIDGVEIAAIHGTNANRVAELCKQHGGKPYPEFEAFLKHRPMDAVILGSPSGMHARQGIVAARQGLHVLTEKPIDINTARADELIAAAQKAGVKLGVIFQDRGKPEIRRLKEWIDNGLLGKVLLVDASVKWYRPPEYYGNSRWRGTLALDGGGALINQAIHTVDLLLWLVGDVVEVRAGIKTVMHSIEAEDTAMAILEFARGAVGTLQASTAAYPGYPRRVEITGSEGTVILEQDRIIAADLRNAPPGGGAENGPIDREETSSPVVSDSRAHQTVFEDFFRAIRENGTPMCDGREGRRSIELVERIYRAAGRL